MSAGCGPVADPWAGSAEEEAERGKKRKSESGFVSGWRWKLGLKLEQGREPGWSSHWCCCRSGGLRHGGAAGDAGVGGGCGGGGWRRGAWAELGVGCCGGRGSWRKQTRMWTELVEAAAEEAGEAALEEEQVEVGRRAAGPNAGPCSPD